VAFFYLFDLFTILGTGKRQISDFVHGECTERASQKHIALTRPF
jgi:hypothetical protein